MPPRTAVMPHELADQRDMVLVGSPNSSLTPTALRDPAEHAGAPLFHLIDGAEDMQCSGSTGVSVGSPP